MIASCGVADAKSLHYFPNGRGFNGRWSPFSHRIKGSQKSDSKSVSPLLHKIPILANLRSGLYRIVSIDTNPIRFLAEAPQKMT